MTALTTPPLVATVDRAPAAPDLRLLGLPGLEQVRAAVRGVTPVAPVSELLGIRPTGAELGAVRFEMAASPWLEAVDGALAPGALAALADAAHAAAVHTTLRPGHAQATTAFTLEVVAPTRADGGALVCRARSAGPGADGLPALSEATIEDATGRLLARSTARNVTRLIADPAPAPPPDLAEWPARSFVAVVEQHAPTGGGLAALLGLSTRDGVADVVAALPASVWLASLTGFVQGGMIVLLAEAAASAAVTARLRAGERQRLVHLSARFVKPAAARDGELTAAGAVDHRGREVAFAQAQVTAPRGDAVALIATTHACGPR